MDKWDEIAANIARAAKVNEPEAALVSAVQFFVEVGRTLELISADIDRLATAAEKLVER